MVYSDLLVGRFSEPHREYLVTAATHRRAPVFADFATARLLVMVMREIEAANHATWLAWVIMPDHFHGLMALGENSTLPAVLQTLKGRSARRIIAQSGIRSPLWQAGYHDHALRREEDRRAVARYIIANPLRAGLVSRIGDYPHWDCVWL